MLTQNRLKEYVNYCPETGIFTSVKRNKGKQVGCKRADGYVYLLINGKQQLAHRMAFLYMTGAIPNYIDHIDCVRDNNIWSNLRDVSSSENRMNSVVNSRNKLGVKGVSYAGGCSPRYKVEVKAGGRTIYGSFGLSKYGSKEEAFKAAVDFAKTSRENLHKEFTNHG